MNFILYFTRQAKLTYPKRLRNFILGRLYLSVSILRLSLLTVLFWQLRVTLYKTLENSVTVFLRISGPRDQTSDLPSPSPITFLMERSEGKFSPL